MPGGGRGTAEAIADSLNNVEDEDINQAGELLIMAMDSKEYRAQLSPGSITRGLAICEGSERKQAYRHVLCHAMQEGFADWDY
jgi:hypothetical protein